MTSKIKYCYKIALKDEDFKNDYEKIQGVKLKKPNIFSDSIDKHIFTSVYLGWRVGKGLPKLY